MDFPDSLPLPLCSICLFNPSHYPAPSLGSAKCDPAPLIEGRGCAKPGPGAGEGSLPKVSSQPGAPATPGGGDKGSALPTSEAVQGVGGALSLALRRTLGPRTWFLQGFPNRPMHPTALPLLSSVNLQHQADFSPWNSLHTPWGDCSCPGPPGEPEDGLRQHPAPSLFHPISPVASLHPRRGGGRCLLAAAFPAWASGLESGPLVIWSFCPGGFRQTSFQTLQGWDSSLAEDLR